VSLLDGVLEEDVKKGRKKEKLGIHMHLSQFEDEAMLGSRCLKANVIDKYNHFGFMDQMVQADVVLASLCDGGQLPCTKTGCMDFKGLMALSSAAEGALCRRYYGRGAEASRLMIQPFMQELVDRMYASVHGKGPRFALYSGHDIVLSPVAAALRFFDCKWPPMGSHIILELWGSGTSHDPDAAHVRVLYNGDSVTTKVPGCAQDPCPLAAFVGAARAALGGRRTHAEACAI